MKRDCQCPRARHVHGTMAAYNIDLCRCFACRVTHANATRAYRHGDKWGDRDGRLVDPTGTRRRLQALAAIGVSCRVIGDHLGVTPAAVSKLRSTRYHTRISVDSATRVAAAYELLWDKPDDGPHGRKVSGYAAAQGWLPPMCWDDENLDDPSARPAEPQEPAWRVPADEVVVDRAVRGEPVRALSVRERAEAALRLNAAGHSAATIAARIGTSQRTITRRRAADRKTAA